MVPEWQIGGQLKHGDRRASEDLGGSSQFRIASHGVMAFYAAEEITGPKPHHGVLVPRQELDNTGQRLIGEITCVVGKLAIAVRPRRASEKLPRFPLRCPGSLAYPHFAYAQRTPSSLCL